eukprot:358496-Chlamydomonas_euryale.AAC.1
MLSVMCGRPAPQERSQQKHTCTGVAAPCRGCARRAEWCNGVCFWRLTAEMRWLATGLCGNAPFEASGDLPAAFRRPSGDLPAASAADAPGPSGHRASDAAKVRIDGRSLCGSPSGAMVNHSVMMMMMMIDFTTATPSH